MKWIKMILVNACVLFFSLSSYGQTRTITGNVQDEDGPLIGVNILIKGTATGDASDLDGNFTITNVSNSDVLILSYTGYDTQEVVVGDQTAMNVTMMGSSEYLTEIIVVGYGAKKKSNVVGSVTSVNIEEATALPTTNVSEMLRGRAAGVQVNLADARPGGNSNIVIRGNVSVAPNGNSPLIIVDGLPFDNLNDVAPDDIANIEILKDAASTAIYGSRASNGVILVTTKSGKEGRITLNYHGFATTQSVTRNFNQYDGQQFIDLRREANRNRFTGDYLNDQNIFSPFELESIANENYVDWEDQILDDSFLQSHSLSLSAGTEKTKIFSSLSYFDQKGIIPNSGYNRAAFKLNLDQKITDKLSLRGIFNYQNSGQDRESGNLNFTNITPLAKPFDENGDLIKFYFGPAFTAVNPLWDQRESVDETNINLTDINLTVKYQILPGLSYSLRTFLRTRNTNRGLYRTSLHSAGDEGVNGFGLLANTLFRQSLVENIVNYAPEIGTNHSIDFTAVQAFDEQKNEFTQIEKSGFTNDALSYNGDATNLLGNPRNVSKRRLLSYLGRVRYDYMDRYLVEFTARADGASVFSENNKWGFFPAASAAWKVHLEPFMENITQVDELKMRVSYGATGNQGINSLETLGKADDIPYIFGNNTVSGATASSRLPNPNLKWETTRTFNAGVDFRLFKNFFEGTIEYYYAKTSDLLLDRAIAGTTGFNVIRFNVGELENKGLEASLITNLIRSDDFNLSVGMVFSRNRNKVLALTGDVDDDGNAIDISDSFGRRLSVGQSINNIWLPQYDGIYQEGDNIADSGNPLAQPGDIRVIDQDANGQIDNRDNVFTNTDPDWYGSINTTMSYKGFQLFVDMFIVQGATRLNNVLANGELWKGSINGIRTKYYTPEFPSTAYPRPKPDTHLHLFPFAVRDASYIRLRTVTLGYTFPKTMADNLGFSNVNVYFTGTNLFTGTDFRSYSPEQGLVNGSSTVFPETRNFTFGLKLGF
ncbi:MAG: TonB-linked SusC/RagA family outer membrane protein [Saprospiraceae bacterium]|jgi:TonB-linked SusC/RagA family outer membrane protein